MGTVPKVEGTAESGPIDPSKFTHDDITDLAKRYRDAVGVISQQRLVIDEANRVIIKLQNMLQALRGEFDVQVNAPGEANENQTPRRTHALPAQHNSPSREGDADD